MATIPFSAAREAALKETLQSGKLALLKQWVDTPVFYCCLSGTTVGVLKNPVPVLALLDRVICVGVPFTLDFSGSWSPNDTLAGTAYTVRWGDGGTTNANFPNPRDAALENETYTYIAAGTYTITMDIQDSLGATGVAALQIVAVDCPYNPPLPLPFPRYGGVIVGTDDEGIFYTDDITGAPVWVDLQSNELVGTGGRTIRSMCFYQPTAYHRERLYAATDCAIYEYDCMPPGCSHWQLLIDLGVVNIYFGGSLTDITFLQIRMSNENPGWGYCVLTGWINGGSPSHIILLHTRDYWQSIFRGVAVGTGVHYHPSTSAGLSIIPGTNDADVVVTGRVWAGVNCWKVTNYASNVFLQLGPVGNDETQCWVARDDPDYWYWAYNPAFRWTVTGGPPFSTAGAPRCARSGMFGPRDMYYHVDYMTSEYLMTFRHGDVAPSIWGLQWAWPGVAGTNGGATDGMVLFRELTGEPAIWMRVGNGIGVGPPPIVRLDTVGVTTIKTGNLATVMGADKAVLSIAKWEDGAGWA